MIKDKSLSFEFFPPKSPEAEEKLVETAFELKKFNPGFFSVTYGAGGSTRQKTFSAVNKIKNTVDIDTAPHLSCIGSSEAELTEIIKEYQDQGFKHMVALRGDLPSGAVGTASLSYAWELVELVRKVTGDHFVINVACYPEFHPMAKSPRHDLENLKRKADAGADCAITQYFYSLDAYLFFMESCEKMGITIPVIPGIMPITNSAGLLRFSEACDAEIPSWIKKRLLEFGDDQASIKSFGVDVVSKLSESLLSEGAPGLHIYTMNSSHATSAILANLGHQ